MSHTYTHIHTHIHTHISNIKFFFPTTRTMGWLRWVGSLKLQVSFAKEPYKQDDILQKRPVISRNLLIVATPCIRKYATSRYGVAMISRLLKIWSLCCRISSLLYDSFAEESYNCKEPTNRSPPTPAHVTERESFCACVQIQHAVLVCAQASLTFLSDTPFSHSFRMSIFRFYIHLYIHIRNHTHNFFDGYCSTVQRLLDWFEVDLGFTELSFIHL